MLFMDMIKMRNLQEKDLLKFLSCQVEPVETGAIIYQAVFDRPVCRQRQAQTDSPF
jgi:hypothetical protein